jgi:hypothetical protein
MADLTEDELKEINEGFADIGTGRTKSAAELAKELGYDIQS